MLTFADSAWHVFSGLLVFLIGFWVCVAQRSVFSIAIGRAALFYFWHTALSLSYFYYSLQNPADSQAYYLRSLGYVGGFGFGSPGVYFITSIFSDGLGLSYGGVFLVYNLFGFIGMLAFASALQQMLVGQGRSVRMLSLVVILLPGLSFWSGAIGKDALTFMGAGLAVWASIDLSRRYPAVIASTIAFLIPRPHMSGMLLASLAVALIFASRIGLMKKIVLIALTVPAAVLVVGFGLQYAGLGDAAGISDLEEFMAMRQGYNLGGGSSLDISSMSVPMRLFAYLFRPLFWDAGGLLGIIVSFENAFLLLLLVFASFKKLAGRKSVLEPFAIIFFLTFSLASWFVLANTTANMGIAVRQQWMFLPMLLMLALSYMAKFQRR